MPSLIRQRDYRPAQRMPFCYLCAKLLAEGEEINRDHLPAQCIFLADDREPLWLPTHLACNTGESVVDEMMGQLIGLRYGKVPSDPEKRRLEFQVFSDVQTALTNLSVDRAVWRWVRGCHAALYGEPLVMNGVSAAGALVTPFPRARKTDSSPVIEPLRPQHQMFVQAIKNNRMKDNLDRVHTNKGKFKYECVWLQADDGRWMCVFAIDLYDWKDLGRTPMAPARGCAGMYVPASGKPPESATRGQTSPLILPNYDTFDPFAP